jgi:anaerobic ribonucleoside-triphosphate reductase activating protein
MFAEIAVSRIHFPVTTLGFGRRVGLWLQGCSIRCPGCLSKDTWEVTSAHRVPKDEVLRQLRQWLPEADGLTVSGGEPLDQPDALRWLLEAVRRDFSGDLLVYSGYSWEHIVSQTPWIQSVADVVISDPYRPEFGNQRVWRGSDNQHARLLSRLGVERYGGDLDDQVWPHERRLDVCVSDGVVWLAGIPRPGDLSKLRRALWQREFEASDSSCVLRMRA